MQAPAELQIVRYLRDAVGVHSHIESLVWRTISMACASPEVSDNELRYSFLR